MTMPSWWDERRFGIFVHAGLSAVPGWAPIGESAARYRSHLDGTTFAAAAATSASAQPLVEVLAHHRDRWGHIEHFDDFVPLLRFDGFDADTWAGLAVDAGARYAAVVARDRDGWAWWDAPTTARTMVTNGPERNVLADFADACARRDLTLGALYSLTDQAYGDDRRAGEEGAGDEVRAMAVHDVVDLVDRFGIAFLRLERDDLDTSPADATDGPTSGTTGGTADATTGGTADATRAQIVAARPALVVDGGRGHDAGDIGRGAVVRTFECVPPTDIVDEPWELRRSLGRGVGSNRNERAEHQLTAPEIVALLTEVIAKGGHLLLGVDADADGAVPDIQAGPLRAAGTWIRRHERLISAGVPWLTWGDAASRLIEVDGVVHAVDVGGHGHFAAFAPRTWRVDAVHLDGVEVPFHQDDDGLRVDVHRPVIGRQYDPGRVDVPVYRLTLSTIERPVELFAEAPRVPIELTSLLRGVGPGDIVQLGDGVYVGPVRVPAGVTIRGLGGSRSVIETTAQSRVVVEASGRIEHLRVRPTAGVQEAPVVLAGAGALMLGCQVDGTVEITGDDATIRATRATAIRSTGADRATLSRCQVSGTAGGVGVHLVGGMGHDISSCEVDGHLGAIHLVDGSGATVRGNNVSARWWGVRLERTEGVEVHGNFVSSTMRGIDIEGGVNAIVHGNAVCDGDSGCVVAWGAAGCSITGNTWERCRIGVLAWEAQDVSVHANEAIDLHEPDAAFTTGP